MKLTFKAPPLLLIGLALAGCGGSSATDEPNTVDVEEIRQVPSDQEIVAKIYDDAYSVPDGFFVDERAGTPRSYTVYHVKDASLSFELCSDDYYQAAAWEEADNQSRAVNGYYVGSHENDSYFEFIRELSYTNGVGNVADVTSPGFARVFKCSSLNRDGVDRNLRDGYAGQINHKPLTAEVVRRTTEYMWQFAFFSASKRKVLDSFTVETPKTIKHTLIVAFAYKQGTDRCDRIEVFDWLWSASRESGEIHKEFVFRHGLEGRLIDHAPQIC